MSNPGGNGAPAGWLPDPANPAMLRYWDGNAWTENTSPAVAPPVGMPMGQPPKKKGKGLLIGVLACVALAVVAVIGGAIAGSGSGDTDSDTAITMPDSSDDTTDDGGGSAETQVTGAKDETDDVKLNSCSADENFGNFGNANITVTNNSSKRSSYIIEITFESPDGATQYGTGAAIINNLDPGQSKDEDVSSLDEFPADGVCKVTNVDRMAS